MPGKPFVMEWATEDTAAALKERYRVEADERRRMRVQGLWLRCARGDPWTRSVSSDIEVGRVPK